ncbi:ankyrin, partial [Massarina eburnea CBS 473.64]
VDLLLEANVDVNKIGPRSSALHQASAAGQLELVSKLLDHGADPNINDRWLGTALHAATANHESDIVKLLLDRNANPCAADSFLGSVHTLAYSLDDREIV